ncbi:hypothetical protein PVAP13_4NG174500 [Panicum virgatum]|uniref:lysine--tRNA ligase n=1 Tax=Panicum virgatum TaxID=38727 RepID=A0A8T0T534_PANVG|nr:hypothetical protein PVAP13_4NG174500 [Panicum virgatum]
MDALRAWRASNLLGFAASRVVTAASAARPLRLRLRCCSSAAATTNQKQQQPPPPPRLPQDRRRRNASTSTSDRDSIRAIRLKKVEELRGKGYEPYAYKWDRTHTTKKLQEEYTHLENGEIFEEVAVSIAGRIVARRAFGKLVFMTIRDDTGTIQLYCEKDNLTEDQFEQLKAFIDIGDIIGASGSIKKTEKGELSLYTKNFEILTKSLLPLPDKYHGLTDVDKRYRQRYVDMIANPEVADVFRTRAKVVSEIRKTMESFGFIEVETPVLQGAAGGAEARPFITYHNSLQRDLYLRIATELHLKRMLVGGLERVYEIGRIFRNEGISTRHNPEFTTIEMYEAYSDYESMMKMAEEIVVRCTMATHGKLKIDYRELKFLLKDHGGGRPCILLSKKQLESTSTSSDKMLNLLKVLQEDCQGSTQEAGEVLHCNPVHLLDMFLMRFLRLLLNLLLYNQHLSLTTQLRYLHWQNHIGVMLASLNDLNFLYVVVKLATHFLSSQTQLIRGDVLKIK